MKKICINCNWFECCDDDGEFLEKGYCLTQDLYTYVEDDETCDEWLACKQREEDLKNGL